MKQGFSSQPPNFEGITREEDRSRSRRHFDPRPRRLRRATRRQQRRRNAADATNQAADRHGERRQDACRQTRPRNATTPPPTQPTPRCGANVADAAATRPPTKTEVSLSGLFRDEGPRAQSARGPFSLPRVRVRSVRLWAEQERAMMKSRLALCRPCRRCWRSPPAAAASRARAASPPRRSASSTMPPRCSTIRATIARPRRQPGRQRGGDRRRGECGRPRQRAISGGPANKGRDAGPFLARQCRKGPEGFAAPALRPFRARAPSALDLRSPCRPCRPCRRRACRPAGLVLGQLAHRRFGGDEQARDAGGVLERGADDLGRVDHAGLDQILVDLGLGVEAHGLVLAVDQLAGDDGAVMARILGDLADRRLQRAADDVDAAGLVVIDAGRGPRAPWWRRAERRRRPERCLPRPRRGSRGARRRRGPCAP